MYNYFYLLLFISISFGQINNDYLIFSNKQNYDCQIKANKEDIVLSILNSRLSKIDEHFSFFILKKTKEEYVLLILDKRDILSLNKYKSVSLEVKLYVYNVQKDILCCISYDDSNYINLTKEKKVKYMINFDVEYSDIDNITFYDSDFKGLYTVQFSGGGFVPEDYDGKHHPYLIYNHFYNKCTILHNDTNFNEKMIQYNCSELFKTLLNYEYKDCNYKYNYFKEYSLLELKN